MSLLTVRVGSSRRNFAPHLYLTGGLGNYASLADSADLDITGDIDLQGDVALNDWTPAGATAISAKWQAAGNNKSWLFRVEPAGTLTLYISTTGADQPSISSTAATGLANGARKWVRVARSQAAGLTDFYTSDDGITWTPLGTQVVLAATSAIASKAGPLGIGQNPDGFDMLAGKVYRARAYRGIAGTLELDADFTNVGAQGTRSPAAFNETGSGATVTVNGTAWTWGGP